MDKGKETIKNNDTDWMNIFKKKEKIKKENGFAIVDYQLKFYGYCADCERNDKTDK